MCGTTTIDFSCGHEETVALANSLCAIAYSFDDDVPMRVSTVDLKVRLFCWAEPQGMKQDEGLCGACRFRKEKYNTIDPSVSIAQLREAGDDIRSRRSDFDSAANSVVGRPSIDAPRSSTDASRNSLSPEEKESSTRIGR